MAQDFEVKIDLEDNSKEFQEALKAASEKILYAWGVKGVEGAVRAISGGYTPTNQAVDTGRLRASISFVTASGESGAGAGSVPESQSGDKLSGKAMQDSVYIGSNVNYAEYVHNGTSRMASRPFLREGIDNTKAEMKEQAEGILKGKY